MDPVTRRLRILTLSDDFTLLVAPVDLSSAIDVAERLADLPGFAFLDSALALPRLGRFSYVAADPFGRFVVKAGRGFWNGVACTAPVLSSLRLLLHTYALAKQPDLPPFQTGAIGYFAYDFAPHLDAAAQVVPGSGLEADFGFYDCVVAIDHEKGRSWLIASGLPETDPGRRRARAEQRLTAFQARLEGPLVRREGPNPGQGSPDWRPRWGRKDYVAAVERVKAHILAGDLYQANITQSFAASLPSGFDPWGFYKNLRGRNPAPYAGYLVADCHGLEDSCHVIASSSPEVFLTLTDGNVETRPIKGTRRRSNEGAEDALARAALVRSVKDRAENVMIVDLLRNDLAKVCQPASVVVPELCTVETYAGLHHLVSSITGQLRTEYDGLDLVAACFPGGSITGAPKLKAMEIIADIERESRGPYCGSMGFLAFNGDMALNIAIRTILFTGSNGSLREARVHAGGGITLLSDPLAEYAESLVKLERIFSAEGSA